MKVNVIKSIVSLDKSELPRTCCGVSVYRGVLILWDEDTDARVLEVVDDVRRMGRRDLVAIHEHEGSVEFFWREIDPPQELVDEVLIGGDVWSASHHVCDRDFRLCSFSPK